MSAELPELIFVMPSPPVQGGNMVITFDFSGTGLESTVLQVNFDPPTGSCSVPLTPEDPTATIQVPDGAGGVEILDMSGKSKRYATPIYPA